MPCAVDFSLLICSSACFRNIPLFDVGLQPSSQQGREAGPGRGSEWNGTAGTADRGLHNAAGSLEAPRAEQGQPFKFDSFQESEWQNAGPVQRRYLAAELFDDDDEDMDDEEAIPGTP